MKYLTLDNLTMIDLTKYEFEKYSKYMEIENLLFSFFISSNHNPRTVVTYIIPKMIKKIKKNDYNILLRSLFNFYRKLTFIDIHNFYIIIDGLKIKNFKKCYNSVNDL